jgi:hypothetical protein
MSSTQPHPSQSQPRPPPPRYTVPVKSSRNKVTFALLALVAVGFTYPFVYINYHRSKNPTPAARKSSYQSEAPLPPTSLVRGAYVNSGSKDVGYDDAFYKKHEAQLNALRQVETGKPDH